MEGKLSEHVVVWNSHFRTDQSRNPANCEVSFAHHHRMGDTIAFRIKSLTLTNLFPNVYNKFTQLHTYDAATPLVKDILSIPEGNYRTYAELDTAVQAALTAAYGVGITVLTDTVTGLMSITSSTTPFVIEPQADLYGLTDSTGGTHSLNLNTIIGANTLTATTIGAVSVELSNPVYLGGPRTIRIGSTKLASSNTVHPNGDTGDYIGSVSLAGTDYGGVMHYQWEDSSNSKSLYRSGRDVASIDIHLHDEYGDDVTLPLNSPVDIEFVVTSVAT